MIASAMNRLIAMNTIPQIHSVTSRALSIEPQLDAIGVCHQGLKTWNRTDTTTSRIRPHDTAMTRIRTRDSTKNSDCTRDRKSAVEGTGVSVRVARGGCRIFKQNNQSIDNMYYHKTNH